MWFVHSRSFAKSNESDKLRIALLKEQFGAKERRSKEGREKERIHKPELSIQFVYQKLSENVGLCWISSSVLRKCKKVTPGHLFYRGYIYVNSYSVSTYKILQFYLYWQTPCSVSQRGVWLRAVLFNFRFCINLIFELCAVLIIVVSVISLISLRKGTFQ